MLIVYCHYPGVDFSLFFSQYDAKTRLDTMSGSTSISSADLFGEASDHTGMTYCALSFIFICVTKMP